MAGLLALPVKAKPEPEPEADDYDDAAEADDEATAASLGDAVKAAFDAGDGAGIARAICDLFDWHMGEEPGADEEEMG